jgi:hypothetical protein
MPPQLAKLKKNLTSHFVGEAWRYGPPLRNPDILIKITNSELPVTLEYSNLTVGKVTYRYT